MNSKAPLSEDEIHVAQGFERALRQRIPGKPRVPCPSSVEADPDEFLLLPLTSVDMSREVDIDQVFPDLLTPGFEATLALNSEYIEDHLTWMNFATHRMSRLGFIEDL